MAKVVVKILQGSAVTQTMLAGQFLWCTYATNYENCDSCI